MIVFRSVVTIDNNKFIKIRLEADYVIRFVKLIISCNVTTLPLVHGR